MVGDSQGVKIVLVTYRFIQLVLTVVVLGIGIYEVANHNQNSSEPDDTNLKDRSVDTVVVACLGFIQLIGCFLVTTSFLAIVCSRPVVTMTMDFAFIILWAWRGANDTFFNHDTCKNGVANGISSSVVDGMCSTGMAYAWLEVVLAIFYLIAFGILVWKCFTPVVIGCGWRGLFRQQNYVVGALSVKQVRPSPQTAGVTLGDLERLHQPHSSSTSKVEVSVHSTEVKVPLRAAL